MFTWFPTFRSFHSFIFSYFSCFKIYHDLHACMFFQFARLDWITEHWSTFAVRRPAVRGPPTNPTWMTITRCLNCISNPTPTQQSHTIHDPIVIDLLATNRVIFTDIDDSPRAKSLFACDAAGRAFAPSSRVTKLGLTGLTQCSKWLVLGACSRVRRSILWHPIQVVAYPPFDTHRDHIFMRRNLSEWAPLRSLST
jgi:hypothetical protein